MESVAQFHSQCRLERIVHRKLFVVLESCFYTKLDSVDGKENLSKYRLRVTARIRRSTKVTGLESCFDTNCAF